MEGAEFQYLLTSLQFKVSKKTMPRIHKHHTIAKQLNPPSPAQLLLCCTDLKGSWCIAIEAKFSKEHLWQGRVSQQELTASSWPDLSHHSSPPRFKKGGMINPAVLTSYQDYFTGSGSHKTNH